MYKLIGYFSYNNKKSGEPFYCMFIGSESCNVKGLKVDTIFVNQKNVSGDVKLGGQLQVNADLRGFVQSVEFR